ncbi:ABC transporter ATP-binding protein [Marinoscillum sp.]|uniref:ABC transporter ATP-binding protein n=1 Tax=Marinoscillum sp. TaxID=2024838 RepID=UPI003BAAEEF1
MSGTVIKVEGLSKRYRIGLEEKADTFAEQLKNSLLYPIRNIKKITQMTRFSEDDESVFWALRDINFEVKRGEVLGIIGHNGAGKSTLLKILSRITEPTSGRIEIQGRVSALLEVGTGFHPELTGRDNVYMNGTILGMRKKEIDAKFDEIVAFSGVEKHIDTPVKFYSSGMRVRLAFSVAAHLEPEILIIDEVLAVGDAEFQKKCLGKMEDVAGQGRTVLFVSHNMAAVESLCTRGIVLENGVIGGLGEVRNVIDSYINIGKSTTENFTTIGSARFLLKRFFFTSLTSSLIDNVVKVGDDIELNMELEILPEIEISSLKIAISIRREDLDQVVVLNPKFSGFQPLDHQLRLKCKIDRFPLAIGRYPIDVNFHLNGDQFLLNSVVVLDVHEGDFYKNGTKVKVKSIINVTQCWSYA